MSCACANLFVIYAHKFVSCSNSEFWKSRYSFHRIQSIAFCGLNMRKGDGFSCICVHKTNFHSVARAYGRERVAERDYQENDAKNFALKIEMHTLKSVAFSVVHCHLSLARSPLPFPSTDSIISELNNSQNLTFQNLMIRNESVPKLLQIQLFLKPCP